MTTLTRSHHQSHHHHHHHHFILFYFHIQKILEGKQRFTKCFAYEEGMDFVAAKIAVSQIPEKKKERI